MDTWINHAESLPTEIEHDHIRFLFYYIAYEAAYQRASKSGNNKKHKDDFHKKIARNAKIRIQETLDEKQDDIEKLLRLRQAHPLFWKGPEKFRKWSQEVENALLHLEKAVKGERKEIIETLDSLFRNLSVVRNQIVHGGSTGKESRGRAQVILGANLLQAIIPCFRDCIQDTVSHDWGEPPFPRVGSERDEECDPPDFSVMWRVRI